MVLLFGYSKCKLSIIKNIKVKPICYLPKKRSLKPQEAKFWTDTGDRLWLIGEIKRALANVRFPPADATPVNIRELNHVLWSFSGYLALAEGELKKEASEPDLLKQLSQMRTNVMELRQLLSYGEAGIGAQQDGLGQPCLHGGDAAFDGRGGAIAVLQHVLEQGHLRDSYLCGLLWRLSRR